MKELGCFEAALVPAALPFRPNRATLSITIKAMIT
jgi:hypothetical protein